MHFAENDFTEMDGARVLKNEAVPSFFDRFVPKPTVKMESDVMDFWEPETETVFVEENWQRYSFHQITWEIIK